MPRSHSRASHERRARPRSHSRVVTTAHARSCPFKTRSRKAKTTQGKQALAPCTLGRRSSLAGFQAKLNASKLPRTWHTQRRHLHAPARTHMQAHSEHAQTSKGLPRHQATPPMEPTAPTGPSNQGQLPRSQTRATAALAGIKQLPCRAHGASTWQSTNAQQASREHPVQGKTKHDRAHSSRSPADHTDPGMA